jgi:hypothetical protein
MDLGPQLSTFERLLGEDLRVEDDAQEESLVLRLLEVDRLPSRPGAPRPEPFRVLFGGPPTPVLPQRIHSLHHHDVGAIELFLVALGPGPDGRMRYESIFN